MITFSPDDVVLFQGDSITDAGRDRELAGNPKARHHARTLGLGYAARIAGQLIATHPGIGVYNRGVSGNRIGDLAARWQEDCFAIKPTVLSILIGINDTWHGVAKGNPEGGTPLDVFDAAYRKLLDETIEVFPTIKLVICEPFYTECGAVTELNFHPDIDERQKRVYKIATDYSYNHGAIFVPFQALFDGLCTKSEPNHWAYDGVHPTAAGFYEMAKFWMKCVTPIGG